MLFLYFTLDFHTIYQENIYNFFSVKIAYFKLYAEFNRNKTKWLFVNLNHSSKSS